MTWFGSLDLAYKYCIVFGSLLLGTILAGCVKVLYDRHRLKKATKVAAENVEAGKDDQVELNQREKDEGDLFGIRAIEAGFYAGIPQSRPTSRAGSIAEGQRSTSTLIGGASLALKDQSNVQSMASSVTTLQLAHTTGNRDSSNSPPRRASPPAIRLAPSEAELNGRINHNAAVDMNMTVPPSPVLAQRPGSPAASDNSSPSLSPRSANFRPDHYAPSGAPQLPLPHGLKVTVHPVEDVAKSEAASFNNESVPSSRGPTPEAKLPSIPAKALSDEPRSLFPQEQSKSEPDRPSSPVCLLPQTYQPAHARDMSESSSIYSSHNRMSTHKSTNSTDSYNFSFPQHSDRNSAMLSSVNEESDRSRVSSSFLAPSSAKGNQTNDPRFSEFYDAYYRNSQIGPVSSADGAKRPNQLDLTQETIAEVDSPLPSPNPHATSNEAGKAV